MSVGIVVGNPKARSRTWDAAWYVARELSGADPDLAIDVIDLGPKLLGWGDSEVAEAVTAVQRLDLLVVASPTYKASFTGLLKLFLDQFAAGSLASTVTIPLMLGGSPAHSLAPETQLRPVLSELGAITPTSALYLIDREWDTAPALGDWLPAAARLVRRLVPAASPSEVPER